METTAFTQVHASSPLGNLRLAASRQGLCGVWFEGQRHFPETANWVFASDNAMLNEASAQITAYFSAKLRKFSLPLDLSLGTAFQQSVWQALLQLDIGQTCSYAALSSALGKPSAVRAVAGAIGRNPLSIVVPCHRVLGANGALTGYAGGLARKAALLALEQEAMSIR